MSQQPTPLPASAVLMALATAAGMLSATAAGWILFSLGAALWMLHDGRQLRRLAHAGAQGARPAAYARAGYAVAPLLAAPAYLLLSGPLASVTVAAAFGLHAAVMLGALAGLARAAAPAKPSAEIPILLGKN
ncbi:hypothetical protein ACLB1G_05290 [Oxalobacteraceae bacterium A2-2]